MMLETLLDIELALLNLNTDRTNLPLNRADIPLKRAQCSHNLSISNIIMRRLRSSLRRGSSCRYLKLNKWRLRSVILTFMPQLGIKLHESLTAKGVLYSHHGLYRDVYLRLNNELRDQASKRKPYSMFISHLHHKV